MDMLHNPSFWWSLINGLVCWWIGYAWAKYEGRKK